jgi:hypothetical protein
MSNSAADNTPDTYTIDFQDAEGSLLTDDTAIVVTNDELAAGVSLYEDAEKMAAEIAGTETGLKLIFDNKNAVGGHAATLTVTSITLTAKPHDIVLDLDEDNTVTIPSGTNQYAGQVKVDISDLFDGLDDLSAYSDIVVYGTAKIGEADLIDSGVAQIQLLADTSNVMANNDCYNITDTALAAGKSLFVGKQLSAAASDLLDATNVYVNFQNTAATATTADITFTVTKVVLKAANEA